MRPVRMGFFGDTLRKPLENRVSPTTLPWRLYKISCKSPLVWFCNIPIGCFSPIFFAVNGESTSHTEWSVQIYRREARPLWPGDDLCEHAPQLLHTGDGSYRARSALQWLTESRAASADALKLIKFQNAYSQGKTANVRFFTIFTPCGWQRTRFCNRLEITPKCGEESWDKR